MVIIDSIHQYKATSGFIIRALEPFLYKIHYLTPNAISLILEVNIDTETTYQHSRICTSSL